MRIPVVVAILLGALTTVTAAQSNLEYMTQLQDTYRFIPNVTYHTASNVDLKVDLYVRRDASRPQPTIVYFHGSAWYVGSKDTLMFSMMPYIAMGFDVVAVQYRLTRVAHAPAAVEDARCALKWVIANAKQYGFDKDKIVMAGDSAGGHLAMMGAFLPTSAGLDNPCVRMETLPLPNPVTGEMNVAAVVNWYGISDVRELLDGEFMKEYAVTWLGSTLDREQIAKRVSPMTYIRKGLPPVFTIHGDADESVPYHQAVRLHKALSDVGVPNELVTVPGGTHGLNKIEQRRNGYLKIENFLRKQGVLPARGSN